MKLNPRNFTVLHYVFMFAFIALLTRAISTISSQWFEAPTIFAVQPHSLVLAGVAWFLLSHGLVVNPATYPPRLTHYSVRHVLILMLMTIAAYMVMVVIADSLVQGTGFDMPEVITLCATIAAAGTFYLFLRLFAPANWVNPPEEPGGAYIEH